MWEVMTYGERPYWELSNHEVGPLMQMDLHINPFLIPRPEGLAKERLGLMFI
jgi:hypothetical protein